MSHSTQIETVCMKKRTFFLKIIQTTFIQIDAAYVYDSYETMEAFLDVHGEYEAALNCQVSTYNHPYDNLHAFTDYLSEVRIHILAI